MSAQIYSSLSSWSWLRSLFTTFFEVAFTESTRASLSSFSSLAVVFFASSIMISALPSASLRIFVFCCSARRCASWTISFFLFSAFWRILSDSLRANSIIFLYSASAFLSLLRSWVLFSICWTILSQRNFLKSSTSTRKFTIPAITRS